MIFLILDHLSKIRVQFLILAKFRFYLWDWDHNNVTFQKLHFSKVPVENKYFPNDFNAICYFFRDLKLSNYACYRLLKLRNIIFSKSLQTTL